MTQEAFPRGYAGTGADDITANTALLDGPHPTMVVDVPSNTAVQQYQLVTLSGSALAVIGGAPSGGEVVGVVAEAADNLTATPAAERHGKVTVYVGGGFNDANIVMSASTVAALRATALGSGIRLRTALVTPV